MKPKQKRGRPITYGREERVRLADLIRQFGARGAREKVGNSVSVETLLKIAREFRIELKKGRRPSRGQNPISNMQIPDPLPGKNWAA